MKAHHSSLKPFLERVYEQHHRPERLSSDPLEFVYRSHLPIEQEAIALVASQLAYGNVLQIRRSVEDVLARILRSRWGGVQRWIQSLEGKEGLESARRDLDGFVHRFHRAPDLLLLLRLLARSWRVHGSLGAHFLSYLTPGASDITYALNHLIEDWRAWARELDPDTSRSRSFGHFMSAPSAGSCCKRWCMFLRWMGRKDELDPGLWTAGSSLVGAFADSRFLRPEQLVIPLDTHTGRISKYLGLTQRKNLGWAAALEVTEALRVCDPIDPVRYDFALARLGILDLCQKQFRVEICKQCQLLPVCIFAKSEMGLPKRPTRARKNSA